MLLKNAEVFCGGEFKKLDIRTENKVIKKIGKNLFPETGEKVTDCAERLILPGLVEIHSHGCAGRDFSDGSYEGISKMTEYYAKNGITSVCATTITMPKNNYREVMCVLERAVREKPNGADIIGINMEGPFLGIRKKGAHDSHYLEAPDTDYFTELDELSGGNIRLVSIDPDYENSMEFIKKFSKSKVISLAHTACDYDSAAEAFENGAKNITHLFNAMNPLLHRTPGVIGAFSDYAEKGVTAELICDGFHIHPSVIRMMFRLCGGNIALVSDSMRAAGLSDGEYTLGGIAVFVKNGAVTQSDGTIAGSAANLFDCMTNAIKFGVPVPMAIKSAAEIPAALVCSEMKIGLIREGYDADLIVLDRDYRLLKVFLKGKEFLGY